MKKLLKLGWMGGLLAGLVGVGPVSAQTPEVESLRHGGGSTLSWQRIDSTAPVRGIDGKMYSATCSGFPGTDPRFSFWARKGKSRNLAIYFEGGGACWDNNTCSAPLVGLPPEVPQFFVPQVPPGTNPAAMDGIFKTDNPTNPVRDWDMVYIPYCTGDIHIGSATKTYTSVGNPAIGLPAGMPMAIQHRGFDNFMVVLQWARKNFQGVNKVLVAGSSAGGYGATANSPWVARAFPSAQMYVVADASQGVTNAAFDNGNPGRNSWNPQLDRRTFGDNTPALPGGELMRRAAQSDRDGRYGQFTTSFDGVQILFYAAMAQQFGPGACLNPAVEWHNRMSTQIQSDASSLRNFRHYVAGGQFHTVLSSPAFYTEGSAGPKVATWLDDMLANRRGWENGNGQGHRSGSHWRNEACPGCLVQVPCQ